LAVALPTSAPAMMGISGNGMASLLSEVR
jgi:hypothetical protein